MRGITVSQSAAMGRVRALAMAASAMGLVLVLSGCGTIDNALFGGDDTAAPAAAAPAPAQPQGMAGTLPDNGAVSAMTAPATSPVATTDAGAATSASVGTNGSVTAVSIEPVTNTGTAVGQTVVSLHNDLTAMQGRIVAAANRLGGLESSNGQFAATYFADKAQMTTKLQVGTTRGNPALVQTWNAAQGALDSLTGNINAMNNLGQEIADISSRAHYMQNTIEATYNVSGAVDEDHRQLDVLSDETSQTLVIIDRLLRQVSGDIQRQTAYVANERASLTTLANAIRNGELYGAGLGGSLTAGSAPAAALASSAPLVTIRFDHAHVEYKQILYSALDQALQARPNATFSVVAVSPASGSAPAVQLAQTAATRHAREVLRAMTDMGVPGARLSLSSQSDPSVQETEVRVYVR